MHLPEKGNFQQRYAFVSRRYWTFWLAISAFGLLASLFLLPQIGLVAAIGAFLYSAGWLVFYWRNRNAE